MASDSKQRLRYLDPATLQKLAPLELIARQVVEGMRVGHHKSPLRGFSTEFAQHRPYVHGDELKHIDWRVYGRSSRYYVKLYEAETNFTATLLVDGSKSMHYGSQAMNKLEYVKRMAASLAYLTINQHDSVGLGVFDSKLRNYVPPKGTMGVIRTIDEELSRVEPQPRTDVAGILHEFAQRIPRRGVVMLFSDLFDHVDEFIKGLEHLRFKGHNVVVFHTLDPAELEFPFDGTCRFRGLENEGDIVTQPRRIRAAYLEELGKFVRQIKVACERAEVDYVLTDTSKPVAEVLTGFLIHRMHTGAR